MSNAIETILIMLAMSGSMCVAVFIFYKWYTNPENAEKVKELEKNWNHHHFH